jgi:ComEC/Rec2-related protein
MTLGWRAGITNEIYEPFMQSGTMHIFAISGLHIALIAGILVAVLRVAQVSRLWCGIVIIPLIWFYTAATGWQPSAIRSTIMMSIIIGGWALNRPSDLLNSLAAAALIILLWEPQQLFQASFQLSFFVVLSIALFLPPLEKIRSRLLQPDPLLPPELIPRWQRWLGAPLRLLTTSFVTSLAAWLGSLPLTAYYFHLFSPVTLLANLLIVPASSAALACNLGSLAFGSWLPSITELFNHSAWAWMWFMVHISHWATGLPGAFVFVPAPKFADFAIYYGALVALLSGVAFKPRWRIWGLAAIPCIAMFYGWRWHDAHSRTSISVIPLSGGSSTFCRPPNRAGRLLIDCGNTNAIGFVIQPFLRAQGVNHLPQLMLTHGDLARVGGTDMLRAMLSVDRIITSPVRFRSPTYRRIVAQLEQTPEHHQIVKASDSLGGWTVLHPAASDRFPQADDNAIVLRGEFNGTRILLLSDLGRPGQDALLERQRNIEADIVVSGLPVQSEPVSDRLLEAVRPQLIIITDSEFPATRRASGRLQERLQARNIPVVYTRVAGSAKIVLRQNRWQVTTTGGFQYSGQPAVKGRSPSGSPPENSPDDRALR